MLKDFLIKKPVLTDKVILITGGTGSFGSSFIKTMIENYHPRKLIVFSRDEMKQYEMENQLQGKQYKCMRYFIGDVRDLSRLEMAFRNVDIVIHAAALKHVHIAEYNPYECIRTNIIGTENVVRAALKNGVQKVIALSTDKAVSPINLYGASKLAAEKVVVAANNIKGSDPTRFAVVRYGNVLGSRGSIIPMFKKLIQERARSLPITDRNMTRFWITLNQGVDFVLSSLALMQGGEIFVPKIPSMRVTELADALCPGVDMHTIGIRPGEKIHEWMMTHDESRKALEMPDRYIIIPTFLDLGFWREKLFEFDMRVLPEPLVYSSDRNSEWLNAQQIRSVVDC